MNAPTPLDVRNRAGQGRDTAGPRQRRRTRRGVDQRAGLVEAQVGSAVLDEVRTVIDRYVWFPSEHCSVAVALWVVHTWAVPAFYVTPRLILDSPEPGSGKTRVLELLALLCRSAKLTLSTTTAALYRRIEQAGDLPPTILQDEADAIFGRTSTPQTEDLRALFNAGYKRGATVDRCEGDAKNMKVREFRVFAPVALAGLAGKMPPTITTRAVTIHMRRRTRGEKVAAFRERDAEQEVAPIRNRLEAWATANTEALAAARPTMPRGVEDRPAEVWEALLAVADAAGGEWPTLARAACGHFVLAADPSETSLGVRLLHDIRDAIGDQTSVHSAVLVARLTADEESPWRDLWGKPLDQLRLAKELKRYGVVSGQVKIDDRNAKGYKVAGETGLGQAFARYLPPLKPRERDSGDTGDTGDTAQVTGSESVSPADTEGIPDTEAIPTVTPPDLRKQRKVSQVSPVSPTCGICGQRLAPKLVAAGETAHPGCLDAAADAEAR